MKEAKQPDKQTLKKFAEIILLPVSCSIVGQCINCTIHHVSVFVTKVNWKILISYQFPWRHTQAKNSKCNSSHHEVRPRKISSLKQNLSLLTNIFQGFMHGALSTGMLLNMKFSEFIVVHLMLLIGTQNSFFLIALKFLKTQFLKTFFFLFFAFRFRASPRCPF